MATNRRAIVGELKSNARNRPTPSRARSETFARSRELCFVGVCGVDGVCAEQWAGNEARSRALCDGNHLLPFILCLLHDQPASQAAGSLLASPGFLAATIRRGRSCPYPGELEGKKWHLELSHSVRFQLPNPLFQAFAVFDVVVARGVFVVGFGLAGARTSVRSNVRVYCGLGKVRDAGGFRVLLRTEVRAPIERVILTSEP